MGASRESSVSVEFLSVNTCEIKILNANALGAAHQRPPTAGEPHSIPTPLDAFRCRSGSGMNEDSDSSRWWLPYSSTLYDFILMLP